MFFLHFRQRAITSIDFHPVCLSHFRKERCTIRKQGYFFRVFDPDGIAAAFYMGGNCAIGLRDESGNVKLIPRVLDFLAENSWNCSL